MPKRNSEVYPFSQVCDFIRDTLYKDLYSKIVFFSFNSQLIVTGSESLFFLVTITFCVFSQFSNILNYFRFLAVEVKLNIVQ